MMRYVFILSALVLGACHPCPTPGKPEGVFPEHRQLALDPACARIVREQDKAAAQKVAECPLQLPDEITLPDWPEATNVVYVTDLYWYPYMDFRALNPYAQYTVPARLPRKPALPLSAWDRMPSDYMTVICTSGRTDEPPPEFFLRRGFRVRLDGQDLPCRTEPANGARKTLEIRPRPGNPRNSEGDFIRLKDGTLLFAWSRYYEAGATENSSWDNGGADIVLRRSPDDGETWSTEDEMLVRNDAMNVMSVSFLRLADGRIALFYIHKFNEREDEILMRTSADEAKTWSEPARVTGCLPKGWYVLNNARVIQLKSGRILVPLAFHRMETGGGKDPAATLICVFSDDGGTTWRSGASVDVREADGRRVDTQEPGVIELKDGRVMMWARTSFGSQYAGVSSDGGETWGPFGPSGLVGPRSPATIRRLRSGALVAIWNDHRLNPELAPRGRRAPLSVALSHDEGKTWEPSVPIEENLADFLCYTAFYEREDGILLAYCTKETRNLDSVRMTFVPCSTLTPRQAAADRRPDPASGKGAVPVWKPGHYQVHYIFTGRGESMLHIFPDGTSMLLDVGDSMRFYGTAKETPHLPDLSRRSGEWVARYVERVNPKGCKVDYFHLSHYHEDHGGGERYHGERIPAPTGDYFRCGLGDAIRFLDFGKVVDRAWPTFDDPVDVLATSRDGTPRNVKAVYAALQARGTAIERFQLGSRTQFRQLDVKAARPGFEVFNLCSNGRYVRRDGSIRDLYADQVKNGERMLNENGMSCGMIVSYGKFRYFTAGDFSDGWRDSAGNVHRTENELAEAVGPVDVAKISHHGHHSMYPELVKALQARVWTACVLDQQHCTDDTMMRLDDPKAYPGERLFLPTYMPLKRPETEFGRSFLAHVAPAVIAEPCHVVLDVEEGGDRYSLTCIAAATEVPRVRARYDFVSRGQEGY